MTSDAEIQTESTGGELTADTEGTASLAESKVDLTEVSEEQQQKDDQQERYDRIREKYNNDTDKIVKAYDEAQKELGRLKNQVGNVPDSYEFNFEGVDGLPEDFELDMEDPLVQRMLPVFKDQRFTAAQANEAAKAFMEFQLENAIDVDAELAALGAEGPEMINRLEGFAANRLTEEELSTFDSMATTADQAALLHKIISMTGEQTIADADQVNQAPTKSAQEYIDEAFAYRQKHASTISSNRAQKERYESLLAKGLQQREKEAD